MASIVNYTGDGTTNTYNITFAYIDANDVAVTVNDVAASFTFLTDTSIQLSSVPASVSFSRNDKDYQKHL